MPKTVKYNDWQAKARMAQIRKQNVERHIAYDSQLHLRERIRRFQVNQTHQMEYDRLLAASVRGELHAAAQGRMEDLKNSIVR